MTFYQLVSWVISAQARYPQYKKELIKIIMLSFVQHNVEAKLADIKSSISNLQGVVDDAGLSAKLVELLRQIDENPDKLIHGMNLVFAMPNTLDLTNLLENEQLKNTKNIGLSEYIGDEFKITGSGAGGSEQFRSDYSRRVYGLNGQYSIGCKTKADKANVLNADYAEIVTLALANILKLDVKKDELMLQAFYKAYSQDLMGLTYAVYGGAIVDINGLRAEDVFVRVNQVIMNTFAYVHENELYFRVDSASGFDVLDMAAINPGQERVLAGKVRYTYKLINVAASNPQFQLIKVESDHPAIKQIFSGEVIAKEDILEMTMPKSAIRNLDFNLMDCFYGLSHSLISDDLQYAEAKATLKLPEFYLSQLSNHAFMLETKNLITNPGEIYKLIAHLPPFENLELDYIQLTEEQINRHDLLSKLYQQVDFLADDFLNQIRSVPVTHQFYLLSAMLALWQADSSQAMRQYLNNLDEMHFPYFYATMIQSMPSKAVEQDLLSYNDSHGLIDETYALIQETLRENTATRKPSGSQRSVYEKVSLADEIIIREAPVPVIAKPATKAVPGWLQRALFIGAMIVGVAAIAAAAAATSGLILVPLAVLITGFVLGGVITAGGIAGLVQHEVRYPNKRKVEEPVIDATYTRPVSPNPKRAATSASQAVHTDVDRPTASNIAGPSLRA